jgi:predicted GH43/DUF377 family glycosyl hydrolase
MSRFGFVLSLIVLLLNCASPVFTQVTWKKHSSPVLPVWGSEVNDPNNYKYTYNPTVIFDSTSHLYRMWYCYQAFGSGVQWCIGYAVSTDCINWFMYSKNPVLQPGNPNAFDSNALFDPFVIKVGNELRLYYDGYNGSIWQTGVATSSDGMNWTKYPGNPILTVRPGTWEAMGCNSAKVFNNGNQFVMLYTGHVSLTQAEVGLATSLDGYAWERNPLNPVLRRGPSGSWDQSSVRGTAAFTGNGKYYLFYDGGALTPIGFATSVDGIVWTKYNGNPVFFAGSSGRWDGTRVEIGSMIRQGSLLRFWYSGFGYVSKLGMSVWQIGFATSDFVTSAPESKQEVPATYRLSEAYPNPFNPETDIEYALPIAEHVQIKVFDALGKEVTTLVDEVKQGGFHITRWKPMSNASGVYFYRMTAGSFSETKKFILLK